jgi:hypothetical protein
MAKSFRPCMGLYFGVAIYLGSTLKTGNLLIRFPVAIALFFVIPAPFYYWHRRRMQAAAE